MKLIKLLIIMILMNIFLITISCAIARGSKSLTADFYSASENSLFWSYCTSDAIKNIPNCTKGKWFSILCEDGDCKEPLDMKKSHVRFLDMNNEKDMFIIESMILVPKEVLEL